MSFYPMMNSIAERIKEVRYEITAAASNSQRKPEDIQLIAVSKTQPIAAIEAAYAINQHHFGESYLQESVDKIEHLAHLPLVWHFIGPIQSNKTRDIARYFSWVHSLDRLKVAKRLNQQRSAAMPPLNVLIQVNIDSEESKSGVAPEQILELAKALSDLPNLRLRGLMAIPRRDGNRQDRNNSFAAMQQLFLTIRAQYPQVDTLSMGMSADLEGAIMHGATMVRVGTAIFGERRT
jgi:PLP dependent protein